VVQPDGDEYTIGTESGTDFLRVPEIAVEIIRELNGSNTIEQVKQVIEAKVEEDVDVLDFVETLYECELIYKIDGQIINDNAPKKVNKSLFNLGKFLFSNIVITSYVLALIVSLVLLIANPSLFPKPEDIFLYEPIGISLVNILAVAIALTFIHEFAHVLAAAKEQVATKLRINIRMVWLVVETDMTSLWIRPKKNRYIPYLAGMLWDFVVILIAFIVQLVSTNSLAIGYSKLIVFLTLLSLVWQCIIFLRTDIYFILSNWKNTSALHENSMLFLKRTFLNKDNRYWEELPNHEKKNSVWFGLLYLIGGVIIVTVAIFYQIPPAVFTLKSVFTNVSTFDFFSYYFWDSFIILCILLIQFLLYALAIRTAMRDRVERRRALEA
jgi:hypothetical protein